jgi:type I restriction enzyme S subunit
MAGRTFARRNVPFIKQTTGIQNLDMDAYMRQSVAVPPTADQCSVAEELTGLFELIDRARSAMGVQIALLSERRRALITAAVTGQIDATGKEAA